MVARPTTVILLGAALVVAAACDRDTRQEGGADARFPVRKTVGGEGDASALVRVGRLDVGGVQRVQADLGRTPPPGTADLWACWDLPPADLAVGQARCVGDVSQGFELTAGHLAFVCSTDPEFGTVAPRLEIPSVPCAQLEIFSYRFEPTVPIAVVTP